MCMLLFSHLLVKTNYSMTVYRSEIVNPLFTSLISMCILRVSLLQLFILLFSIDNAYTSPSKQNILMHPSKSSANSLQRVPITQFLDSRYSQDIFTEHVSSSEIRFGHVSENPKEWEQRYERRKLHDRKHQGKVQWGNQNGDYGEHYWDLNHR